MLLLLLNASLELISGYIPGWKGALMNSDWGSLELTVEGHDDERVWDVPRGVDDRRSCVSDSC